MRELMLIFCRRLFYHFHLHRVFRKRVSGSHVTCGPDQEAVMLCFYFSAFHMHSISLISLCVCVFVVHYMFNIMLFIM